LCGCAAGRAGLTRIASSALKLAADGATFLRAGVIERKAYSGLFNLNYYNGFFNELDDVDFLFRDLENNPI
jgi:hypothetical protein